ncbi:MAG: hypothetical protein FJ090_20915 [Deltaproteobacteria bacterium]|nr:hypothetical protein [Deltaproteobacteria bacterium]
MAPRDTLRALLVVSALGLTGVAVQRLGRVPEGTQAARDLLRFVDPDADGEVSRAEFDRVSDGELPFAVADMDGSGKLEPWEIDVLITYVSPSRASMSWVPRAL